MTEKKFFTLELSTLIFLSILAAILFRNSQLDFWAAQYFYHPNQLDPWFEQNSQPWLFFYHAAPWLTCILLLPALALLIGAQFKEGLKRYRLSSFYVFLVIALGPGLVINSVFKPYWGRPRPREVLELGGNKPYQEFYIPKPGNGGKSFPCGHCSVGFSYAMLWWLLRRKNLKLAGFFLAFGSFFGIAMGIGRIAAGGHFLSDVIWAGLMVYWVSFITYYFLLRIPEREHSQSPEKTLGRLGVWMDRNKGKTQAIYGGLSIATLAALLLASPFYKEVDLKSDISEHPIALKIVTEKSTIKVIQRPELKEAFLITGTVRGFGFPSNKLTQKCSTLDANSMIECSIKRKGIFSDYESVLLLEVGPQKFKQIQIEGPGVEIQGRTDLILQ